MLINENNETTKKQKDAFQSKIVTNFKLFIVTSGFICFCTVPYYIWGGSDDGVSSYSEPLAPGHGFFTVRSIALIMFVILHFISYRSLPKYESEVVPEGIMYWIPIIAGAAFNFVCYHFFTAE